LKDAVERVKAELYSPSSGHLKLTPAELCGVFNLANLGLNRLEKATLVAMRGGHRLQLLETKPLSEKKLGLYCTPQTSIAKCCALKLWVAFFAGVG
jgi:hypothetical protein